MLYDTFDTDVELVHCFFSVGAATLKRMQQHNKGAIYD
ncbi:UNVERIFIED_ORG: hypothetical protein M2414_004505 [Rahnella aquatilis]|jgi:hypothetical protein